MNLDAHIQQKTNLCRPWSDLKTCFVINHKNGILFIFESIYCCLYICHTLNPKKSSKYGFIHYWCCIPWIAWGGCAKNEMQHIFNTIYAIQNDATLPKIKTRTTNRADMLGCCVRTKCAWYHYWLKLFRPPVPSLRKSCF